MNWSTGYSAAYYLSIVDPITWRDTGRIEIESGSISREMDGLQQSAEAVCRDFELNQEQWVRVYMEARQDQDAIRIALFTGLAMSPDQTINGQRISNNLECYSVLKPADDVILERGWYAAAEMDAAELIKQLLAPVPAPLLDTDSVEPRYLTSAILAEDGETNLTMIERILAAVNWQLRINGDGTLQLGPYSETHSIVFDPLVNDIIETEIKKTSDWYECPNVFMAINGDEISIVKDEDDESDLSIQNRRREVWMYESSCDLADNETISAYALRRLKEEQRYAINVSYDRRYVPDILPGDLVLLRYPAQGLDGLYMIESQDIDLGYSAKTSESVIGVTL